MIKLDAEIYFCQQMFCVTVFRGSMQDQGYLAVSLLKGDGEMSDVSKDTMLYRSDNNKKEVAQEIAFVCQALSEKGYNPVDQLVGYLLSGDPTYITSHNDARTRLRSIERYELLEALVESYLSKEVGL